MRKDGKPPEFNRKTFPFRREIYVVFDEFKEIWMKGSFAVAMAKKQLEEKHCANYKLCLVSYETLLKLKENPDYIYELKQEIKEREDAKEERPTDPRGSSSSS